MSKFQLRFSMPLTMSLMFLGSPVLAQESRDGLELFRSEYPRALEKYVRSFDDFTGSGVSVITQEADGPVEYNVEFKASGGCRKVRITAKDDQKKYNDIVLFENVFCENDLNSFNIVKPKKSDPYEIIKYEEKPYDLPPFSDTFGALAWSPVSFPVASMQDMLESLQKSIVSAKLIEVEGRKVLQAKFNSKAQEGAYNLNYIQIEFEVDYGWVVRGVELRKTEDGPAIIGQYNSYDFREPGNPRLTSVKLDEHFIRKTSTFRVTDWKSEKTPRDEFLLDYFKMTNPSIEPTGASFGNSNILKIIVVVVLFVIAAPVMMFWLRSKSRR